MRRGRRRGGTAPKRAKGRAMRVGGGPRKGRRPVGPFSCPPGQRLQGGKCVGPGSGNTTFSQGGSLNQASGLPSAGQCPAGFILAADGSCIQG